MKYLIFTDKEIIKKSFEQSGYTPMEFHQLQDLREVCKRTRGAFVYLDRNGEDRKSLEKHISYLSNRPDLRFALVDVDEPALDPACFFHIGAVDYISPQLLKKGLTKDRLEQVQRFNPIDIRYINNDFNDIIPFSGPTWENVDEGKEYVFAMLYAGLDDMARIQELLGKEGAEKFTCEFREWLNNQMDAWYGYQWLWNDWGGVYLFPFDGKNFYAMEAAMECFLNKRIARFSHFERKTTFRFILHLGSAPFYKRGNTGNIISDSINSLFHMAYREGSRDELVISQEVKPFIPPTLLPIIGSEEEFEGRTLYRFKDFK
jgi:hypothetical protein